VQGTTPEFDYPKGKDNVYARYDGTGAFWGRFFESDHDTHVFTLMPVPVAPAA